MKCNYDQKICQGCILVVKLPPPLFQNHIFSPNPQLKKQVILQVSKARANFEEEPTLQTKFLYFICIMERFGALFSSLFPSFFILPDPV